MRFMTWEECKAWSKDMAVPLTEAGLPERSVLGWHSVKRDIPPTHMQLTWFCRHLEQSLQPRTACLLWVTETGVWPSSENLHLYYRLRQSYADNRLIHEAPGHYFLDYEGPDLVSFLTLAVICGWDAHLLPVTGYARAFVSHDEYVEFASDPHNKSIADAFSDQFPHSSKSGAA